MNRSRIAAALLFGSIGAVGVALYATDQHPSSLFRQYCAKCHGEDGKAKTPKGRQLKAQDFTDGEWQADKKDEDLIKTVMKGGEDMPAFGKKLSKKQIQSLVKEDVRGFDSGKK